jgi:2-succinyl-5-enolpyruvyl-6-hydroxy-3-cyclohexene-1-carboxylate synthase
MNASTEVARAIVDELVRCGATEAVMCPGSRNAPLAFALHAADAAGLLRLHVRIDERTAGFLALGLAIASGRPVPVMTTSGTAAANLLPAVLEASHAGVPLLVVTADRPPELVGTGASQTIAQVGMFGAAVRLAPAVGGTQAQVRAAVDRAVTAACGTPPGPVHLNLPFAEPLIPDDPKWPAGRDGGAPWTSTAPVHREAGPLPLDPTAPTVVIAGPGSPTLDVGVPVIAEPSSAAWPGAHRAGPWLLGLPDLAPQQVVVAGRPTLHRAVARLLADPNVAVYALADERSMPWTDVAGSVRAVGALPPLRPDPEWLRRWTDADKVAATALDDALDDVAGGAPVGLRLARALVAALPAGAQLVLGSSNPVRDVALAAAPREGLVVRSNRGVAGIDGTVSTAIGAALAHNGPTAALLGDLTMLHDTTGLVIGPDEPRPDLTLVVLNDNGGGIFNLLEQGAPEHASAFERVFGTPHRVDLTSLCAAMGIPHVRAEPSEVAAHLGGPGLRMVEVVAERGGLRAGHAALRTRVIAAVGR